MPNTPSLRFPEFSGEWRESNIEDVTSVVTKGTTPSSFSEDGINYIKIESIDGIKINLEKCLYITEEIHKSDLQRSILHTNDILFSIAGSLGRVAIVEDDVLPANTNQALAIIRLKDSRQLFFILQLLQSLAMKRYIKKSLSVGAQPNLSLKQVKDFKFYSPSLPEQQKIADFLTAIDEKITLTTDKISQLESYKRGMMQKLLSGELCFPEFSGEWREVKLESLAHKMQSGGTPKATKKEYYSNGTIPFVKVNDITSSGKYLDRTQEHITEDGLNNSSAWIVPAGSIIYSMYASIGYASINRIDVATSQAMINILPDSKKVVTEYLYYYLVFIQQHIQKYIETGTQGNLNAKTVRGYDIPLPAIDEQQKIADFLSSLDDKLTLEKEKLDQLKRYKQGLLQRMFV